MPTTESILGAVILMALMLYALLGGADFGGGFWDLTASGPRRQAQRALISQALAPVWEVNHIWLILAWVLLFTAVPKAFAAFGLSLHLPLTLFMLGVVARGSAFAFQHFDTGASSHDDAHPVGQRWGWVFSVSSLLAPLLLGLMVGALASGHVGDGVPLTRFTALTGFFALALFSFLAAVYLCVEASEVALAEDFRRRALGMGVVVGVLAGAVLLCASTDASWVFQGLWRSPWAALLQIATGLCALTAFVLLWRRRYAGARLAAIAQVALIVVGWGAAQYPYLIVASLTVPGLTLESASAQGATQRAALWVLSLGALLLIPSLLLLFRVFKKLPKPSF
jgi:cytochrome d ubiquinol oxidase subunit II